MDRIWIDDDIVPKDWPEFAGETSDGITSNRTSLRQDVLQRYPPPLTAITAVCEHGKLWQPYRSRPAAGAPPADEGGAVLGRAPSLSLMVSLDDQLKPEYLCTGCFKCIKPVTVSLTREVSKQKVPNKITAMGIVGIAGKLGEF